MRHHSSRQQLRIKFFAILRVFGIRVVDGERQRGKIGLAISWYPPGREMTACSTHPDCPSLTT